MDENAKYLNIKPIERKTPILWGENGTFNKKLTGIIIQNLEKLKNAGYSVMTGTEQEFTLSPKEIQPTDSFLKNKREFLSKEIEAKSIGKQDLLNTRLEEIKTLTPQELLVLELNLSLPNILEFRFGHGNNEKPIYDAHGVFEAVLIAKEPLESIANYNKFTRKLEELAKEYSQNVIYWKRDFSFSVTEIASKKNLMDISEKVDDRAKNILSGVLAIVHDTSIVFAKEQALKKSLIGAVHSTGFSRKNHIRTGASKNCFEIRVNNNPLAGDNLTATTMLTLIGIKYGLFEHYKDSFKEIPESVAKNKNIFTSKDKYDLFFTKEILNGAEIKNDGSIRIDPKDLFIYNNYLANEWGLEKNNNHNYLEIFNAIKVDNNGKVVLQKSNCPSFTNIETTITKLSTLSYKTTLNTIENKGFPARVDYNDDHSITDPIFTNLALMLNSKHLANTLSPSIHSQMVAEVAKFYGIAKENMPHKRTLKQISI